MSKKEKNTLGGYVYLFVNHEYGENIIKIGFTNNIDRRLHELNSQSGVIGRFELYAYYETSQELADTPFHDLIDRLNPDLRIQKNREFFRIHPKKGYEVLKDIAAISGYENQVKLASEFYVSHPDQTTKQQDSSTRKSNSETDLSYKTLHFDDLVNFGLIHIGDVLFIENKPNSEAKVIDNKHVLYNGTPLSPDKYAKSFYVSISCYTVIIHKNSNKLLDDLRKELFEQQKSSTTIPITQSSRSFANISNYGSKHTLFENNYSGLKAKSFDFRGEHHEVRNLTEMLVEFCGILYKYDKNRLLELARENCRLENSDRYLFSFDESHLYRGKEILNSGIFIETNNDNNRKIKIIKMLIDLFDLNPSDFVFYA